MNKSVREEIEKEAEKQSNELVYHSYEHGRLKKEVYRINEVTHAGFVSGAEFGYKLALQHCQVLREALGYMVMRMIDVKMESQWLDEARKALEQFDKIMGE